jgi:Tol biopolymer transport system component
LHQLPFERDAHQMSRPRLIVAVIAAAVLGVTVVVVTSELRGSMPGSTGVIVFSAVRLDHENSPELYAINADGSRLRRLTWDGGPKTSIAWSPDGTRLAYAILRYDPQRPPATKNFTSILSVRLDGTDRRVLCTSCSRTFYSQLPAPDAIDPAGAADFTVPDSLSWSPDGSLLATPAPSNGVLLIDVTDGRTTTIATPEPITAVSWSPDGRQLAMSHTWFMAPSSALGQMAPRKGTHFFEGRPMNRPGGIYLLDMESQDVEEVLSTKGMAHVHGWTQDGRVLAFTRVAGGGRHAELAGYSVEDDRTWPLIPGERGSANLGVGWSPSGERIAALIAQYDEETRPPTLSIVSRAGTQRVDIASCAFEGVLHDTCAQPLLAWSPDGEVIAYRVALAGSPLTPMIVLQGTDRGAPQLIRLPGLFPDYLAEFCCLAWHPIPGPR